MVSKILMLSFMLMLLGRHVSSTQTMIPDDFSDKEELGKIDCGHVYHVDCIKEWIMLENSCAVCKRRLKFFFVLCLFKGTFATIEMDSYQFDADNLTFNGINDANSESLPSEHVPLVNRNGATGAEISADSVSVPSDSDGVYVEHDVRLQLVDNDILRYLHCSCGKKRKAVEVITAYLLNHSHQGESWFCQVFCGFSVTSDASSSNHITGQSNVMSHSTGIREIATCTHSVNSANAGSGENTVDSLAAYTQTIIPESEDEQEVDEDAELNLTVENEESEDQEEDEDAEQNLTVENEGSDGEQEEVEEDDEPNGLAVEDEAKMELSEYIRTIKAGLKVQAFYLCIKLHKYESAKSTCTESKVHCCICLEDYSDEEELGKIDCGHMYHVDCIKEWVMRENTCPMCKREALARLPCFV